MSITERPSSIGEFSGKRTSPEDEVGAVREIHLPGGAVRGTWGVREYDWLCIYSWWRNILILVGYEKNIHLQNFFKTKWYMRIVINW